LLWHTMHTFTPDCVLLAVANLPYDEADYIRDYDEFKKHAGSV
ncbi:WxcM-like domain-containing protein, partial [Candidatus Kaiserbacteria bacterium]|nr:WxcM-like domain-containing protein [Candidatus Kaiserbacteria bacterium]